MSEAPPTSFILDGIREMIIANMDPSEMGSTPEDGVNERLAVFDKITHEMLEKQVDGYYNLEAKIAETAGSTYTDFLLGIGEFNPLPVTDPVPPVISLGVDQLDTYVGTSAYVMAELVGGNLDTSDMFYEWYATIGGASITITTVNDQIAQFDFLVDGVYRVRCRGKSASNSMMIFEDITFNATSDISPVWPTMSTGDDQVLDYGEDATATAILTGGELDPTDDMYSWYLADGDVDGISIYQPDDPTALFSFTIPGTYIVRCDIMNSLNGMYLFEYITFTMNGESSSSSSSE
jgi:hypothetical protein